MCGGDKKSKSISVGTQNINGSKSAERNNKSGSAAGSNRCLNSGTAVRTIILIDAAAQTGIIAY